MITPYPLSAPPRNLRVLDKYPLGEPLGAPQAVRQATALRGLRFDWGVWSRVLRLACQAGLPEGHRVADTMIESL